MGGGVRKQHPRKSGWEPERLAIECRYQAVLFRNERLAQENVELRNVLRELLAALPEGNDDTLRKARFLLRQWEAAPKP